MKYVLSFDILPGKAEEFWSFMEETAAPFWRKFPEVRSFEVFSSLGGPALYQAQIEFPDYSVFERIHSDSEWKSVSHAFMGLVDRVHRQFLTDERKFK